ncbi:probable LRR receptor-like serine/threonine-protein kinase at5g37450 [Phtheirospermum japonicum]|uniref:Probable LRR receptor-like serine/threonine-protein kinase at5g37450 n=1 Tax=Phtheirospermum japonicum TaxID=374723 RepID=A0A830BQ29_9LAMI|nr:probable LRR receptor-like serine/threonine-protein kinase at5g37450 [Phtheirospermum japonicum]
MLLARLHHRNLVNLVGYCAEKSQHMLIYVYMIRESLASHLYSKFSSWPVCLSFN